MQPQSRFVYEEIPDTELNDILINAQDNYTKEEMQAALNEKSRRMNGNQTTISETPPVKDQAAEWYYIKKGKWVGTYTSDQMCDLMNNEVIDNYTKVWKQGMKGWMEFGKSSLAAVSDERGMPPPLPGSDLSNVLVWILAFTPIIYLVLRFALISFTSLPVDDFWWYLTFVINSVLCLYDNHRLRMSGYEVKWQWFWGLILLPIYLFRRVGITKQKPWYAILWCVSFAVMLFIPDLVSYAAMGPVRNGKLEAYGNQAIGQAVNGYFSNPNWQIIKGTDGKLYVNITGNVVYQGSKVSAKLQFLLNGDNTFQIHALEINGKPQNMFGIYGFLNSMYGFRPHLYKYNKNTSMRLTKPSLCDNFIKTFFIRRRL